MVALDKEEGEVFRNIDSGAGGQGIGEKNAFPQSDLFIFYMLWPIIISPKEVQLIIFLAVALVFISKYKLYFDSISFFLLSYIAVYAFSIVYNLTTKSFEMTRILATINSLGIWVLAAVFFLIYTNIHINKETLKKVIFVNYLGMIGVWFFSTIISSVSGLERMLIFNNELYYSETFNGEVVVRFVGLMEYPNLVIIFTIFFYPFYYLQTRKYNSKLLQVVLLFAGLLPVLTTYSRSGYLIILGIIVLGLFYSFYNHLSREVFIFMACSLIALIMLVFAYTDIMDAVNIKIQELASARTGSNDSRQFLMVESFTVAWKNSPLIGMGIKDASSIGYPLGSHSTILGFFYKTGIIGLLLGFWMLIMINSKLILVRGSLDRMLIKSSIIMMPFLFLVEDMDGSNWLMIFYFSFVAILLNENVWEPDK